MSPELPFSKSQVDRAGRALRRDLAGEGPPLSGDEFDASIAVVEAFRTAHRGPLLSASSGLRSCIATEASHAVELTQRLKRRSTIIDKLRRLPTMKLSSMQDIGGCRAVFSAQDEVSRVQERFMRNSLSRNQACDIVRDYVATPRPSGYRGVHVWTRYADRRIEVQLRTERQHAWAKLVEDLVVLTGIDYKSGDGPDIVHQWLRRLSERYALTEAGQPIAAAFMEEYDGLRDAAWARIGEDATREGRIRG